MNVIKDRVIKSREFISLAAALIIDWIIASLCKRHVLLVDAMFSFIFLIVVVIVTFHGYNEMNDAQVLKRVE